MKFFTTPLEIWKRVPPSCRLHLIEKHQDLSGTQAIDTSLGLGDNKRLHFSLAFGEIHDNIKCKYVTSWQHGMQH